MIEKLGNFTSVQMGNVQPALTNAVPDTDPEQAPQPGPGFTTRVPAGNLGPMFFDMTYTDPAQVPHLLAHAITLATHDGGPGAPD